LSAFDIIPRDVQIQGQQLMIKVEKQIQKKELKRICKKFKLPCNLKLLPQEAYSIFLSIEEKIELKALIPKFCLHGVSLGFKKFGYNADPFIMPLFAGIDTTFSSNTTKLFLYHLKRINDIDEENMYLFLLKNILLNTTKSFIH